MQPLAPPFTPLSRGRYTLLRHELPPEAPRGSHFDLLLEHAAGVLCCWALERWPPSRAGDPALRLPDHRLHYLTYEGEISGGRGSVARLEAGTYQLLFREPPLRVELIGSGPPLPLLLESRTAEDWLVRRP